MPFAKVIGREKDGAVGATSLQPGAQRIPAARESRGSAFARADAVRSAHPSASSTGGSRTGQKAKLQVHMVSARTPGCDSTAVGGPVFQVPCYVKSRSCNAYQELLT